MTMALEGAALFEMFGAFGPVTDAAERQRYERDWTGECAGRARMVLRPRTVEEAVSYTHLTLPTM